LKQAKKDEKIHVGGQAVLEGVMMRSPDKMSVAVRKPNGTIAVKIRDFISLTRKSKLLGFPIIRGGIILIESMVLGIQALNLSGEIAIEEENKKEQTEKGKLESKAEKPENKFRTRLYLGFMVIFSLGVGIGLFFYVPLILTNLLGVSNGIVFNLIDGVIRVAIFLLYLFLISQWKEIKRVFEYHGAEHKSIFAFEREKQISVEAASKYKTFHPRCGTSFLMVVLITSIIVFIFLGKPDTIPQRLIRLAFIPLIGGLSYELIKLSDKIGNNFLMRSFLAPGIWLQRITTQEPDEKQLEVAIVALKAALGQTLPANIDMIDEKVESHV
jgi:uncharacterized protein YqhQ